MEIIYAAVFNGLRFIDFIVPTVCTVGYKYVVGFADLFIMKVKELKQILETFPDDLEIVLSKDIEGNEFRPLYLVEKYDDGIPREVFGCNQKFWNFEVNYTKAPSLVLFPVG